MAVSRTELLVLALIAERPRYGYELLEALVERGGQEWIRPSRASVYSVLHRLEREGAVTGADRPGKEGPDRRVYRLARGGRDRLRRGLLELAPSSGPYENEAAVAFAFLHLLPSAQARAVVAARERALVERRAGLAQERARVAADGGSGSKTAVLMLRQQDAFAQAELRWLAGVKRELGRLPE